MEEWFKKNQNNIHYNNRKIDQYIRAKEFHDNQTPYKDRTVDALRFQCWALKIRTAGNKDELVARLERFDNNDATYDDMSFRPDVIIKRPREEHETCFSNTPFPSSRDDLPLDVWVHIFSFLKNKHDFGTILDCRLLCKYIYRAATSACVHYTNELFGPDSDIYSLGLLRVLTFSNYSKERNLIWDIVPWNFKYGFMYIKQVCQEMPWDTAISVIKSFIRLFGCIGALKVKYHINDNRKSNMMTKRRKTEELKTPRLDKVNQKAKEKNLDIINYRKYPEWFIDLGRLHCERYYKAREEFNVYLKTGKTTDFVNAILKKLE